MNNEPQAVDPPEILAIKRAFGKLPPKLTYQDGVIRFRYLRPIDILPGVIGFGLAFLIIVVFLSTRGLSGLGLSAISLSAVFTYLYLQWIVPRLNAVAVLSKEGIGLERNGETIQFYKWIQVSRMTVGLNPNSPIYLWSSTELLGKIPTLFTTFSTTSADYRVLQATILMAFSGDSAPFFRDHVSDFEIGGKFKWFRIAVPFLALCTCLALSLKPLTVGQIIINNLVYIFAPLVPIFGLWLLLSIIEWHNYIKSKDNSQKLSIISIGNSTLSYDLKKNFRENVKAKITYRSTIQMPSKSKFDSGTASIAAGVISLAAGAIMSLPVISIVFGASADSINMPQLLIYLGAPILLGIAAHFSIKNELMVRRDSRVLLQFAENEGCVIVGEKSIPISSFGSSRQSYSDFVMNPPPGNGTLIVNAGGKTYYFSPIRMVTISDHELMNYLPEFD